MLTVESVLSSVANAITYLPHWLTANLPIAIIGGFVGAFGGALGAQRIAERTRHREDWLRELRNTNAATMASFSICNAALITKVQHTKPLRDWFNKTRDDLGKLKDEVASGRRQRGGEYNVELDLKIFPAPVVPIEPLKDLMFQKLSVVGRPLALVSMLEQSVVGARDAIARREAVVQRFAAGQIQQRLTACYYFGLELPNGHIDKVHADLVEAIYSYVDDIAFFSEQLCADLIQHGNQLRSAFSKRYGRGAPEVSTVDFSRAKRDGLLPPASQYTNWLRAFAESSEKTSAIGGDK